MATATQSKTDEILAKAQETVKGYADKVDVAKVQETVKGYADKVDVAKVQETVKGYADKVDVAKVQETVKGYADTVDLGKVQDTVLDYLAKAEGYVVDGVRTVAEKVEGYVPEVSVPAEVPTADQVVEGGFTFAQRVLDNQKDFAKNLLDASAPVRNKARRPVAPVTATKAAKSKAA
jgi:chaperonin GroEL (HSP60 family)